MTQNNDVKWVRLGDLIKQRREKNDYDNVPIYGVSRDGFIPPKQKEADTKLYNIFYRNDFVFNPARMEVNSIALNDFCDKAICSSLYEIFYIKDTTILLPEYLNMFVKRDEFARCCEYLGFGSAREYCRVEQISQIVIPIPSIERQREIVNTWQGLRKMKEENEAIAAPLLQLCQSYIQDLKHKYPKVELGDYIEECNEKNTKNRYDENSARGVNTNKEIQPCKRIGDKLNSYKIVYKNNIVFNANIKLTQDSEKFAVALYEEDNPCIVTGFYIVMKCDEKHLLPKYLMLWLIRNEFARFVKFNSCSSVRDRFVFSDMKNVKIPIPPVEIQQAVVDIYRCANEAKQIADEADRLSRDICPALMQHVIHENQ